MEQGEVVDATIRKEATVGLQPVLPLELNEAETVIRPERNLEKWPIWEAANSRHQMQERVLQREIRLPDGSVAVARVKVGYTNNGALTTEDQKTCYALFRLWEEQDKPNGPVCFSRQQLARVLKKSWGSKTNKALTDSLMRLRFTPFNWERSYFDSTRQETLERIDTFSILSELHLARRTRGDSTIAESSYFQFNERILNNLLAGFTRPVYLDTILKFQSEIAQILYTYLDLVMADKTHFERRSKELFEDLGIDGTTYRYPSKRAEALERALSELTEVPVPTGTLTVTLERTADNRDFKIVAKKTRRGPRRRREEATLALPMPELAPPVVTRVVNVPPDPRRTKKKKPPVDSKETLLEAPVRPAEAFVEAGPTSASSRGRSAARNAEKTAKGDGGDSTPTPPVEEITAAMARAQVRHFYQVFFQAGETTRPTSKELALSTEHVSRLGVEKAQYLVQFARREAKKTGFEIQNYGGIAQYEGRAVAEYEANERQRHAAQSQRSREGHRQRYLPAYLEYLSARLAALEVKPTPVFEEFRAEEQRRRTRMAEGSMADSSAARRFLESYDAPEARLNRFRDFLSERNKRGERMEGVLAFWEWDAQMNPEGLRDS